MKYQDYLEKLYALVTKRLRLGALRLDGKEAASGEASLIDELLADAKELFLIEEDLLSGDEFAPLPYLYERSPGPW